MKKESNKHKHGFHLVDPSPWPLFAAFSALILIVGFVVYLHAGSDKGQSNSGVSLMLQGLLLIVLILVLWWRDVIREGTIEGHHTSHVQRGFRIGVILFIMSEIMFFFAFFWAFFHSSFNPSINIGAVWPPAGMMVVDPWGIPLINTIILLGSGSTVTYAHLAILKGDSDEALNALIATLALSTIFSAFQTFEYSTATFSISDNIYATNFYMITGLHGIHVCFGAVFLKVCCVRLSLNHYTKEHHLGLEAAIWYWHFVDVVWLFVFVFVYWWGGS